ncbi:unnamed protein product, partial [marine sediment metagenome]
EKFSPDLKLYILQDQKNQDRTSPRFSQKKKMYP